MFIFPSEAHEVIGRVQYDDLEQHEQRLAELREKRRELRAIAQAGTFNISELLSKLVGSDDSTASKDSAFRVENEKQTKVEESVKKGAFPAPPKFGPSS